MAGPEELRRRVVGGNGGTVSRRAVGHIVPGHGKANGGARELPQRSAVLVREKRGREMERRSWTRGTVCSGESRRTLASDCGGCEPYQGLPRRALEAGSRGRSPVKTETLAASSSGRNLQLPRGGAAVGGGAGCAAAAARMLDKGEVTLGCGARVPLVGF
jgi:hypothetical protein